MESDTARPLSTGHFQTKDALIKLHGRINSHQQLQSPTSVGLKTLREHEGVGGNRLYKISRPVFSDQHFLLRPRISVIGATESGNTTIAAGLARGF